MRFIDSSVEIIEQEPGILGVYKQIEKAARLSYKSEDRITFGLFGARYHLFRSAYESTWSKN